MADYKELLGSLVNKAKDVMDSSGVAEVYQKGASRTRAYSRIARLTLELNGQADALRKVHAGGTVVSAELALAAWDHSDQLTDRERELLRQVADGATNRDIARRLHLAEGTVRNYLSAAMAKLGARNRTEAAKAARERGWI